MAPPSALLLCLLPLFPLPALSSVQRTNVTRGFTGTQMNWIDHHGLFLLSPNGTFALGFHETTKPNLFTLSVIHQASDTVVWTANRASPVTNADHFGFSLDGDVYLQASDGSRVWSTGTQGKGATSLELSEKGNLVLLGSGSSLLWQSFSNPTDTLLAGQIFTGRMELASEPNDGNLTFRLAIASGNVYLRAGFRSPQSYWSMWSENRVIKQVSGEGDVATAEIRGNSWNFYDGAGKLLSQFMIQSSGGGNATWAAVLGNDGFLSFKNLDAGVAVASKVPAGACDTPEACGSYFVCTAAGDRPTCTCPEALGGSCNRSARFACGKEASAELVEVEDVGYFALGLTAPTLRNSNLASCKNACSSNCSCVALFFDVHSGNCFNLEEMGSLKQSGIEKLACFVKVPPGDAGGGGSKTTVVVVTISVLTAFVVCGILYVAFRFRRNRIRRAASAKLEPSESESDEDRDLLGTITGMPVRFSYAELQQATGNFSEKLGHGGFGCVYLGTLPDGSRVAVKKLEGIGQGRKEFRAEVSIIGSIHHVHLVKLRGFCSEGQHRLLAYEYLSNGSLDRWLFGRPGGLDWDTRYAIAVGTAKGLAYLHEDCEAKIVHCDIKPENVLLDEQFQAKVSDFGLAKLMTREQSHVFTTLRGTRGYLAPEWIISSAISEKSDVYSYGMVLLEILAGRKSFDASAASEMAHLPTYAFRMVEAGRAREVLDAGLLLPPGKEEDWRVETAVKVALWCVQEDVALRPAMGKVVQMLEGVAEVPQPPLSSQMGYRLYASMLGSASDKGVTTSSSSAPSTNCNSDAYLSAVRLSGPR